MPEIKRPIYKADKISTKRDPLTAAIGLMGESRKLAEGRKSSADIVGNIAEQSHNSLGGSTQGWRSIASGFTQGLKNASDLAGIHENDKIYKEHQKVIDYFMDINNQSLVDNEEHRVEEKAKKAIVPDFWGYKEAQKLGADPQTSLDIINKMAEKVGEITGKRIHFKSGLSNDSDSFVTDDGEIVNIPAWIFGEQYTNGALGSIDPEYQLQLQEQRNRFQEKQALEERKVRSYEDVNRGRLNKYEAETERIRNPQGGGMGQGSQGGFEEGQQNIYPGEVSLSTFKGPSATAANRALTEKISLGTEASNIDRTLMPKFLGLIEDTKDIDSFTNRNLPEKLLSKKTRAGIAEYDKMTSQITQSLSRAMGTGATDAAREMISKGMPSWDQPYESRLRNFETKLQQIQTFEAYGLYAQDARSRGVFDSAEGFNAFLAEHPNLVPLGLNPEAMNVAEINFKKFEPKREELGDIETRLGVGKTEQDRGQNPLSQVSAEPYIIETENGPQEVTREEFEEIKRLTQGF